MVKSKKIEDTLRESQKDGLFRPDYVEYDHYGQKAIRCMRCGVLISNREVGKVSCPYCKREIGVERPLMKRLDNFRTVKKELDDGSYIELMVCDSCAPKMEELSEKEIGRIEGQIVGAYIRELDFLNPSGKDNKIEKIKDIRLKRE